MDSTCQLRIDSGALSVLQWIRSWIFAGLLNVVLVACQRQSPPPADASEPPAPAAQAAILPEPASPVGWPDLSSTLAAGDDGSRDAAVIVAIEDYAFLSDIPGAVANGRAWFSCLTRSRKVPVERVTFLANAEATDFAMLRAVSVASSSA